MAGNVFQLDAHDRMTVDECAALASREAEGMRDLMVIGFDHDGRLVVRSSAMDRKDAVWLLLAALDYARGMS